MNFSYISDLFGEYRGYDTRYTPIEKYAIETIGKFYRQEIGAKEFAERMLKVRDDIFSLDKKDERGNTIIDQDSPLWVTNFMAFKFLRWNEYRTIQEIAETKPELKQDPRWPRIMSWASHFDRELHEAMKYCLDEWERIHALKHESNGEVGIEQLPDVLEIYDENGNLIKFSSSDDITIDDFV